jgi:DNA-binding beta-propeller fold protein YncE
VQSGPSGDPRAARRHERRRQVRRRRIVALVVLAVALAVGAVFADLLLAGTSTRHAAGSTAPVASRSTNANRPASTRPRALAAAAVKSSDRTRLRLRATLGGNISPKSVASSGTGLVFAQNMMYRHTVTVYNSLRIKLVKTIPDTVRLAKMGYPHHPGISHGAPVEAAFSPDRRYAYVSNYSMYGYGFGPEGTDTCTPSSGYDRSFVYRIPLRTLRIDKVYRVGEVPKVVAVTKDGRFVLVSNWCSWDLSVVSTRLGRQVKSIPMGAYPRGIAIAPSGKAAFVAVMGETFVVRVDLRTWRTTRISIGSGPRALVAGPTGRYLYATLNAEGRVARLDLRTGNVITVATGSAPRSMTISPDGRALYVVNYESGTISKLRAPSMRLLQTIPGCFHPIGITYDAPTHRVWVACYTGSIRVYNDS